MLAGLARFRFAPANPRTQIGHGPTRALVGRAGDVVELDAVYAAQVLAWVPGADGGPCLVPLEQPAPAVETQAASVAVPDPAPVVESALEQADAKPLRRRRRGR